MSDAPTKTYPPEFLQRLIAGHEAEKDAATTEECSAVQAKGDAMSEIKRFDIPRNGNECMHEDPDGEYVQYDDHRAEVERLTAERHQLRGDLEALTAERDEAQAEVEQLWRDLTAADGTIDGLRAECTELAAERDAARAEVERLRANGQALLDTSRPSDEDIWREGFMRCLNDVAAEDWHAQADLVLTTYRKRWPR